MGAMWINYLLLHQRLQSKMHLHDLNYLSHYDHQRGGHRIGVIDERSRRIFARVHLLSRITTVSYLKDSK